MFHKGTKITITKVHVVTFARVEEDAIFFNVHNVNDYSSYHCKLSKDMRFVVCNKRFISFNSGSYHARYTNVEVEFDEDEKMLVDNMLRDVVINVD